MVRPQCKYFQVSSHRTTPFDCSDPTCLPLLHFSFRLEVDKESKPYKLPELVMRAKDGIRLQLTPI